MVNLIKTKSGFEVYDSLPEDFHLATMVDYNKDRFKHNTPFLVKRVETNLYDTYRVNTIIPARIIDFIKENRVFIYRK